MVSQIKEFYFLIVLEKWLSIYYVNKELNTIKTFTSQSSTLNLFQKTNKIKLWRQNSAYLKLCLYVQKIGNVWVTLIKVDSKDNN